MGIPGIVARQTQVGVEEWEKHMARHKQTHGLHTTQTKFLDALASLDFKLSVSQSLSDSPFSSIKASASTGLSELFCNLYFCTSTDMLTKKFDLTIFLSIKRA